MKNNIIVNRRILEDIKMDQSCYFDMLIYHIYIFANIISTNFINTIAVRVYTYCYTKHYVKIHGNKLVIA